VTEGQTDGWTDRITILKTALALLLRAVKITRRRKGGRGAAHNLWYPFNIYTIAVASDLKFSTQLGFAKAHHKITPGGNVGMVFC